MAKTVRILSDDPVDATTRHDIPVVDRQPGAQTPPATDREAEGKSIFDPDLELGMP